MSATRAALTNYIELAIKQDWPAMAKQSESREVTQALNGLYTTALQLTKGGAEDSALLTEMFKQLDAITQARRMRLHLATGAVPEVLWFVLDLGAILTVGFTFFFGTRICGLKP